MTTIKKGNKVVRITEKGGIFRVVVSLISDISAYGDVLVTRSFKTLVGAKRFSNKELA